MVLRLAQPKREISYYNLNVWGKIGRKRPDPLERVRPLPEQWRGMQQSADAAHHGAQNEHCQGDPAEQVLSQGIEPGA